MSKREKNTRDGKAKVSTTLRLPEAFHWNFMRNFANDLQASCYGPHVSNDLKQFQSFVRSRDILGYLTYCKVQWGLKFQSPIVNGPTRSRVNSLLEIRGKRMLTAFQKYKFPDSQIDKQGNALALFTDLEKRCERTNEDRIFRQVTDIDDPLLSTYDNLYTYKHLAHIRHFIQMVLGCDVVLDEFLKALRHGPGASTDKAGNNSIFIRKFVPPIGVSPSASPLFSAVLSTDERWSRSILDLWLNAVSKSNMDVLATGVNPCIEQFLKTVDSSKITTVPKDGTIDRTICIEPTANVYMQLAVDRIIRTSLKKFGIDLDTQTKNQELAMIGSITNELVTIDLAGASDTIALAWLDLFPKKWATLLSSLRMVQGVLPNGDTIVFHKLSAMGNGYTFVCQSLIYAAMYYAVLRENGESWNEYKDFAIYGDDIIIPVKYYSEYSYLLHRLGFKENISKTFSNGPIRESCGHDYFHGKRIDRPTFKNHPKHAYELVIMHNTLFDLGFRYGVSFNASLDFLKKYIPKEYLFYGPPNEDLVGWLFSEEPPVQKKPKFISNWQGLYFNLKQTVVGHPTLFKRKKDEADVEFLKRIPRALKYFVPMVFLTSGRESPSCEVLLRNQSIVDWARSTECVAQPPADYGLFSKNLISVRSTVKTIPIQEWPSAQRIYSP